MDLSGAMPSSAWVEIRDVDDNLLASIPARIEGGGLSAELPTFAPGTLGSIQLCTEKVGVIDWDEGKLEELPTEPIIWMVQLG